jgi:hypothetical protein
MMAREGRGQLACDDSCAVPEKGNEFLDQKLPFIMFVKTGK